MVAGLGSPLLSTQEDRGAYSCITWMEALSWLAVHVMEQGEGCAVTPSHEVRCPMGRLGSIQPLTFPSHVTDKVFPLFLGLERWGLSSPLPESGGGGMKILHHVQVLHTF